MTDISRGAQVDAASADLIGEMGEMGVPTAPERFDDYTGSGASQLRLSPPQL